MSNDFNWTSQEDSVVIPRQDAIAVYSNPQGGIVIRREADFPSEDEDVFIVIDRKHARAVIEAIERELREPATA